MLTGITPFGQSDLVGIEFVVLFLLPWSFYYVVCFCLHFGLCVIYQSVLLLRFAAEYVCFLLCVGRYPRERSGGGGGDVGGVSGLDESARRRARMTPFFRGRRMGGGVRFDR